MWTTTYHHIITLLMQSTSGRSCWFTSTKHNARCTLVRSRPDRVWTTSRTRQTLLPYSPVVLFRIRVQYLRSPSCLQGSHVKTPSVTGSGNSVFRCCRSYVLSLLTGYQAQSTADQQCQQMNGEGRGCSAIGGWAGDSVLVLRLLRHLCRFTLLAVNGSQTVNTHRTQQHKKLRDVTASISKLVSIQQNSILLSVRCRSNRVSNGGTSLSLCVCAYVFVCAPVLTAVSSGTAGLTGRLWSEPETLPFGFLLPSSN